MTLIVLLILAGVSLSAVFSEKGIFGRVEKAGNKYNEAKAREVLETVLLADGQYEKHSNPKYNQDDFLNELIKKEIEGVEIKGDVAVIDGWAFLLDRSVPKIGEPLGRADSLIFPTVRVSEAKLATDYRTASFIVTAIEATNGINKIEIWLKGEKIKELDKTYNNVKEEIEQEFTVNKNGIYTVKVYGKLMASETVEVTGIVPAVEFSPNGNTDWKKEHQTKITVKTNETITSMKYLWTTSGTNPPEISDFNNAELCTNNSTIDGGNDKMTGIYYLWVLLTIGTGENQKTNICGSEGFNFDNEGPTVTLDSTPVSETSFTLIATASDDKSGIERYEFYIDGERKEPTSAENGTATYTWNGTEMAEKNCYVIVYDKAQNEKKTNIRARTLLYSWKTYSVTESISYSYTVGEVEEYIGNFNGGNPYYPGSWDCLSGLCAVKEWNEKTGTFTETGHSVYYSSLSGTITKVDDVYWQLTKCNNQIVKNDSGTSYAYTTNDVYGKRITINNEPTYTQGSELKGVKYSVKKTQYPENGYFNGEWYVYDGIS